MSRPSRPLPSAWTLTWADPNAAVPDAAVIIRNDETDAGAAVALAFVERGWSAWSRSVRPSTATIVLRPFPTMDEALCLYLMATERQGEQVEQLARYAADARQGYWPDRNEPSVAVQAVFNAVAQDVLVGAHARRDAFVEEVFALFEHVLARLELGDRLFEDDLFAHGYRWSRHVADLREDHHLYAEDRGRGRVWLATVPATATHNRAARRLPMLVLERPVSRQFKLWARADAEAPGGRGFALLLVELGDGDIVLSSDPARRVQVSFAAEALTRAENGEDADASWYAGERHRGTIVGAPDGGTRLSLADVEGVLRDELDLQAVDEAPSDAIRTSMPWLAGASAAVALGVVALVASGGTDGPSKAPGLRAKGAKGEPLTIAALENVLDDERGPSARRQFALVAGVCRYANPRALRSPCDDARAVKDLLVGSYGYRDEDVILMVDDPKPKDRRRRPTADNLKAAIARLGARDDVGSNSSFLFYYSGHGDYVEGAHGFDYGVLQPAGFFENRGKADSVKGWRTDNLFAEVASQIRSRHILLVLDACYAGTAAAKGGPDLDPALRAFWREPAWGLLAAAQRGEQAFEGDSPLQFGGHSAFTNVLLTGLATSAAGDGELRAEADLNGDGLVTASELAGFVGPRVSAEVERVRGARQHPGLFRYDESKPRVGEFIFVPKG